MKREGNDGARHRLLGRLAVSAIILTTGTWAMTGTNVVAAASASAIAPLDNASFDAFAPIEFVAEFDVGGCQQSVFVVYAQVQEVGGDGQWKNVEQHAFTAGDSSTLRGTAVLSPGTYRWRAYFRCARGDGAFDDIVSGTRTFTTGVPDSLASLVPARLVDSRSGEVTVDGEFEGIGRRSAGSVLELTVVGRGGVPAGADAVLMNVTAVVPDGPGFLTVYPCGEPRPNASHVNYGPGDVVPNAVLAKVGAGGKVCIYTLAATDVIADVNGYVP